MASELQTGVVVLDINMPGIGGLEAIPLLRAEYPGAAIIMLTLMRAKSYHQAAMAAGADGYVFKQDMLEKLIPAILQAIDEAPE